MQQRIWLSEPLHAEFVQRANQASGVLIRSRLPARPGGATETLRDWWRSVRDGRPRGFSVPGGMGMMLDAAGGIAINDSRVPQSVKDSYETVTKARAAQDRVRNEADQQAEETRSAARNYADATVKAANDERHRITSLAKAYAESFERLLAEYRQSPENFRRRKRLETLIEFADALGDRIINLSGQRIVITPDAPSGSLDLPNTP
jgi:hypothetical protein